MPPTLEEARMADHTRTACTARASPQTPEPKVLAARAAA